MKIIINGTKETGVQTCKWDLHRETSRRGGLVSRERLMNLDAWLDGLFVEHCFRGHPELAMGEVMIHNLHWESDQGSFHPWHPGMVTGHSGSNYSTGTEW